MPSFIRALALFIAVLVVPAFVVPALVTSAAAATVTHDDSQSFTPREGDDLKVELSVHDVVVRSHNRSSVDVKVHIEVDASREKKAEDILERLIPEIEQTGRGIVIDARSFNSGRKWWDWSRNRTRALVEVWVPAGMAMEVSTASGDCELDGDFGDSDVECGTASGDVLVEGSMGRLSAGTASGDLQVTLKRPVDHLALSSASGDVEFSGGAGRAEISTASGEISVKGLRGEAELASASGDILATWDAIGENDEISAETASGDVRLVLPSGASVVGEVETHSGRVRSDFDGRRSDRRHRFRFDGGAGAAVIYAESVSGDIEVLER